MAEGEPARCDRCGTPARPGAADGLCPGCLLAGGLEEPPPTFVSDYEILDQLGRGGMGVIYRARHREFGQVVALKVIRAGELADDDERRRFVAEIRTAARLSHSNIVPVHAIGEHAGCPFFTMPVFPRTLRDLMATRFDPVPAAALVATVARAVHHAHDRGVLHRDLKPENILVDEAGQPHVADFSVAKRLDEPGLTAPGVVIGTRDYMAPEQARGDGAAITQAADQYSLGVLLYELITGWLPSHGQATSDAEPRSPRIVAPGVSRDLATVCLKCLAREPGERYRTVGELADDLERVARGEPPAAGPSYLLARAWRFARRHRLAVTASASTLVLLVFIAASALLVARAQEHSAMQASAFAAEALAGEAASYLQTQVNDVVKLASDVELPHQLQAVPVDTAAWLMQRRDGNPRFENLWLFDTEGNLAAQTDGPPEEPYKNLGKSYVWRDYFKGARAVKRGDASPAGYVALVVQSEADDRYKFVISAPFYDEHKAWIGVIVANTATSPTALGNANLVRHDSGRGNPRTDTTVVALVAPLDRSRDESTGKDRYVVIVHDGLQHPGDGVQVDASGLAQFFHTRWSAEQLAWTERSGRLPVTSSDYHDPVPEWSKARWLAAFAPVAHTGYVVIVQTRYDAWVTAGLLYPLIGALGVAVLAWGTLLASPLWNRIRHRRRGRATSRPA